MMEAGADNIRERAYHIWEREGRPHGRDLEHWLQAEREVRRPKATRQKATAAKAAPSPLVRRATGARSRTKKTH